jgi:uncharacterized protein DUF6152
MKLSRPRIVLWRPRSLVGTLLAGASLLPFAVTAGAHHSFAIFDEAHPVELIGTVEEFRFLNPHSFIVLQVKTENARPVVWQLEGQSANSLRWSGWSAKSLKPGDQLRMTIEPLRSGAPGGAWSPNNIKFLDGSRAVSAEQGAGGR